MAFKKKLTEQFATAIATDLQDWLAKHKCLDVEVGGFIEHSGFVLAVPYEVDALSVYSSAEQKKLTDSVQGWLRRNYPGVKATIDTTDYTAQAAAEKIDMKRESAALKALRR